MRKILFCKISAMKYYKGVVPGLDEAYNGGSYVAEHGEGHEQFNFDPVMLSDGTEYCLGFVETKSSRSDKRNTLHIERINGCSHLKNEPFVEDVLVIWCATTMLNETSIVGWYQHADVYRQYESAEFNSGYIQDYNVLAKKKDCFLLPASDRHMHIWQAPVAKKRTYGFGQSMVWYAEEPQAQQYLEKLIRQIECYRGENWIDRSVDNP